ncbi:MAG: methyl-accepting chemotaxis protein [Aquabacterium sp.]
MSSLKVARRLSLSFFALGLLLALVMGVALQRMAVMQSASVALADNWLPSVELVNKMNTQISDFRIQEYRHVASLAPEDMAEAEKEMADIRQQLDKYEAMYVKLITTDQERALYDKFDNEWKQYKAVHDKLINLSRQNLNEEARNMLGGESRRAFRAASATLLELVNLNHEGGDRAGSDASAAYDSARWTMAAVGLVAVVVAVVLSITLTRSITAPLAEAVALAERVAAGDLTSRADVRRGDEFGDLLRAMGRMTVSLSELVGRVRSSTDSIATAASQIASGNADLSQRTEEQASALQQTASTMEELGSTVRLNADSAQHADQLARDASAVAGQGGDVVSQVVGTMKDIHDSSRKIADIISVIDGIAFQTNILALNAAVEAARAGEQGRGFAVVAGEVRTLAQRSAEAAKEIKGLITASVQRVEAGTALADRAGSTMNDVVAAIRRVTDIMGEIATSSAEQSNAVSQVGDAVSQMDQVTQQNAALVEQSAAAAASLRHQAETLVEAISVFKIK